MLSTTSGRWGQGLESDCASYQDPFWITSLFHSAISFPVCLLLVELGAGVK